MLLFYFDKTERPDLIVRIRQIKLSWCPHYTVKIIYFNIKNLQQICKLKRYIFFNLFCNKGKTRLVTREFIILQRATKQSRMVTWISFSTSWPVT